MRLGSDPPTKRNGEKSPLAQETLKKYLEVICNDIKARFGNPSVPAIFSVDDVRRLKEAACGASARTNMVGKKESDVFKECFPIPRMHTNATIILPFDDFQSHEMQQESRNIDMLHLCRKLFRYDRYADLLKLQLTFNGIARGGEIKFLTYDKMFLCKKFNCLFAQWFQRKAIKTCPSGFCMDFQHPELCVFFSLGLYWSFEQGLVRNPSTQVDRTSANFRRSKFLFQDLHKTPDDNVARILTNLVKSIVPSQLKPYYSIKSFRYGAMSELTWNPQVTYEEACALGGWSTNSNRDWYVWIYLVSIVPSITTLAGYPDPRNIPPLPNMDCLYHDTDIKKIFPFEKLQSFIDNLFVINLPDFAPPNGRLRNLLLAVVAIMIKNYKYCETNYKNSNQFVNKMITATVRAEMAEGSLEATILLRFWSEKLRKSIEEQSASVELTQ